MRTAGTVCDPLPLQHSITATRRVSPSRVHFSSSVPTSFSLLQKGGSDLPSVAVRFSLLEVAQRGQLRPRRKDGPSFPQEPAGQGPRICARRGRAGARLADGYRGGATLHPRCRFPT